MFSSFLGCCLINNFLFFGHLPQNDMQQQCQKVKLFSRNDESWKTNQDNRIYPNDKVLA